ncbi:hypothetical protein CCY99_01555 [Helicobacter sp. 16-1353]|uniref:hypothetical protein n=1 Tax=Helicobacter sp. 16-1353 TaxID=2004996 RepID=UPI000DCB203D|nr:hypothetical protein [Helicobacter sp. 16-1353]RAX54863.1 hypothetical protein CCY99_01555 [Helicobacter sp. 16-1353]
MGWLVVVILFIMVLIFLYIFWNDIKYMLIMGCLSCILAYILVVCFLSPIISNEVEMSAKKVFLMVFFCAIILLWMWTCWDNRKQEKIAKEMAEQRKVDLTPFADLESFFALSEYEKAKLLRQLHHEVVVKTDYGNNEFTYRTGLSIFGYFKERELKDELEGLHRAGFALLAFNPKVFDSLDNFNNNIYLVRYGYFEGKFATKDNMESLRKYCPNLVSRFEEQLELLNKSNFKKSNFKTIRFL